jgi:hypothetical protein
VQPTDPTAPPLKEYRATLRIDAQPGGKKFQGVWLDFGDDTRWVIDYRPRELWRGFADHEVTVTGHCYRPFGQAINAPHFRVATMSFVRRPATAVPYFSIGPERWITGAFRTLTFPAGSKRAGDQEPRFHDEHGTAYHVAGEASSTVEGPATIRARVLERNRAYTATTGEDDLWIVEVHEAGHVPAPSRDTPIDCP